LILGFLNKEVFFFQILEEFDLLLLNDLRFSVFFSFFFSIGVKNKIQKTTDGIFGEIIVDGIHDEVHCTPNFVVERGIIPEQILQELDEDCWTKVKLKNTWIII
jgi:hypothetical protein